MAAYSDLPDPSEPDLYWSGHSGFAMLPGVVVGVLASAAVMLVGPPAADWVNLREDWAAFLRFWLVLLGWVAAGLVWSYRGAAFVYRLTPVHIYVDFGMLYRPVPPVLLTRVTRVECGAWALRRLFRVGSVVVHAEGRNPLSLPGIFRPELFAAAIRDAVARSQRSAIGGPLTPDL
jgi:membrane protein YdbS with pleckstrin-like domain